MKPCRQACTARPREVFSALPDPMENHMRIPGTAQLCAAGVLIATSMGSVNC